MTRSTRCTRILAFGTLAIAISACSDTLPVTTSESTHPALNRVQGQNDAAAPLVRAFAAALEDPAMRRLILEDLRDSPFRGNRLHLQSYLRGPRGASILARGARRVGSSQAELIALSAALPNMEIVVPVELHRIQWTGTDDIVVAGTALQRSEAGRRGTIQGFTVGGEPVDVPLFSRVPYTVILLVPTQLDFGPDPEARRQRAPKKSGNTIIMTADFSSECDPLTAVIECPDDDNSGGVPAGGQAIPSGFTYQCMVPHGSPGDADADGVLDLCEFEVANTFRPYMAYATNDSGTGREEYWAVKRGDTQYSVQVFYAQSYYDDGGDPETGGYTRHQGDSEWIVMQVSYHGGKWRVDRAKLSAHWGAVTNSTETVGYGDLSYPDGTYRGRPLVWSARNKHANYKSRSACNSGAWWQDDCSSNTYNTWSPFYALEILSNANLGNVWSQTLNCVLSRKGLPGGRYECYWQPQYKFYGWQIPTDGGAGPYYDALAAHLF
jgi:hypothetical protein